MEEKSVTFDEEDIISGERIQMLADKYIGNLEDLEYNPLIWKQKDKHIVWSDLNEEVDNPLIIFCYNSLIRDFHKKIHLFKNNFILISHNGDTNIDDTFTNLVNNSKIIKWYAQNALLDHSKLVRVPIGIANSMWSHGDTNTLIKIINQRNEKKNSLYFNFNIHTNPGARNLCYNIIRKKGVPWIYNKNYENYLQELSTYKYCVCPIGNGLDTHRFWECLYLGVVPVTLKNSFNTHWASKHRVVTLDSWNDLDVDELVKIYSEVKQNKHLLELKSIQIN